ncbi:MAG: penicillin-binding protein activator [Thermodesulfobacteriota bacterium]
MRFKTLAAMLVLIFAATEALGGVYLRSRAAESWLTRILAEQKQSGSWRDTPQGVIDELEEFLSRYPNADVTDGALVSLALIYAEKENVGRAISYYEKLLDEFPKSSFRLEALYGLSFCRYTAGRKDGAREALSLVVSSEEAPPALRERAVALLKEVENLSVAHVAVEFEDVAIGVVLPLTGKYARFGEEALNGVRLAARVFGESYWPVHLKVRDVGKEGGEGGSVLNTLRALAADRNVVGLVGPLMGKVSVEMGRFAQQRGLPAVILSQKSGLPGMGEYVFRNFLTPARQAGAVADYAYYELGLRAFAVLHPENPYGEELAWHFKEEVEALGGVVVAEGSYEAGQTDFKDELEGLFAIEVTEGMKGRRHVTGYEVAVEADALYIPDYHHTAGLIAPYLAYYDMNEVVLLGSNGWNSPGLVDLAGEHVEGAVFVDGFFSKSDRAGTVEFMGRFTEVYGYEPGILEAHAYDAAMALLLALRNGPLQREAVRKRLAETTEFEGASGPMAFGTDGEVLKDLFLLTVKDGEVVELK